MTKQIETYYGPSVNGGKKPWLVMVDGEFLKGKTGIPRRFATKEAAVKAALTLCTAA